MPKIRLVRDQLIPHAKVAVIGESPGKEEVLAGQPFVGPSGSLLNRFLFSAGLRRSDVAVLNVSLRRPSHNSDDIKIIPKEELDVWMQDLRRRLTLLPDVRLIVPLGNTALEAVLGTEKVTLTRNKKLTITKARGFYFDNVVLEDGRKVLVVPCFHPAATFRDQTLVKVCEEFWEKIGDELRRGLVSEHNTIGPLIDDTYTIEGMPHPDDALDFAHQIIRDGRDAPPVSYDIETPREVPREKILCVGFSNDGKFGMTIPFDDHRAVGPKEWREKFQESVRLIVNSNVPKIGQNLLFDAHMLMFLKSIWSNEVIYDTRTMDLVLDPRRSHDLGSMVSRFLRARMWKDREEDSRVNDDYVELAEYCASDALHTWHVAMKIKALLEEQGLMSGYKRIYKARFYPLLRMQLEGTLVDQKARVTLYESLEKECASVRAELAEIAGVSLAGDEDKSLSDKKIASFLYGMKDPPKRALKLTKTGQVAKNQPPPLPKGLELKPIIDKDTQKPTTNEVALRTLRLRVEGKNKRASHAIDLILRHREKHQLSTFLRGERVDKDDRMRCSFGFAETGRLTSSSNPVGTGCVPGDAEILTPSGWKRFDSIDDLVQAMVWDPKTNTLRFQSASRVSFDYTGEMCAVSSWFHSGLYTPDHRIPWVRATKAAREQFSEVCQSDLRVDTANSFSEPHSERLIPISSLYLQGQVSFPEIRLLAAVQADGSFEPDGSMRIALYKPRKIKRFKEICSELKLEYTEHRCQRDGTRFRLKRTSVARCFELLGRTKQFGSWLLAFDQITLKTLIEEAAFWDGSIRNRSYQYSSIYKNNVEWLCTIAHLVGYSGSFRCKDNRRPGSFGEESAKPLWTANIKPRDYTNDESKHWNTLPFSGRVYCLTTSTGFFLCRQNGRIVITGNSNTQNPARPMRHIFLPNPGCIFVSVDLSCVEDRIIKCYSKDPDLIRLARLPAYDYDAHKDLAAKIFGVEPKDVDKAQRYMGKKVRHASQRNVKGQRFADELLKEGTVRPKSWCDEVLEAYHIAEPGIRAGYFPYVEERVMKYEELVSPWGYRVSYKGERKDPDLMREAYSFLPQAGAVFTLDTQGLIPLDWLIAKEGLKSSRINNQVHDSVIVSCPLDEAYFVAEFLVSNLEKPVEYDGVDLSVPSEVKLSATLADDDAVDWKRFPSEEDFMREAEKMFEIAERRRHESQMFAVEWKKKVRIQAREEAKQKEEALRLVEEEKARKVAAKEAEKEAKRLAREEKKIERERLKAEKLAAKAEAKEARRLKREAKAAATNKTK